MFSCYVNFVESFYSLQHTLCYLKLNVREKLQLDEKSNEENKSGNHVQESMDGIPKKDSRYNSIRRKGRKTNHKAKVIIAKNE